MVRCRTQVEQIQLAHSAQVAELRGHIDSLRTDNSRLMEQQQEMYVDIFCRNLSVTGLGDIRLFDNTVNAAP